MPCSAAPTSVPASGTWSPVTPRGARPREVIDHSIGPVWEANHVWLIFIFVVLWTGFSEAYASITLTLFVPLTLAALGIVLRGSSFAFRKTVFRTRDRRNFGAAFASPRSSSPTAWAPSPGPSPRAACPRAVSPATRGTAGSTRRRCSAACSPSSSSPTWPPSTSCGTPAGQRPPMVTYFRRRAIGAAVVAGVAALVGIFVLREDARYVFDGLTSRALPLVIVSAVCGSASLVLLVRDAARGARILAIGAVASLVIGWGVAQWPYMLPTSLKVSEAAAPSATLAALFVATILLVVIVVPGFTLLYILDQKSLLPEEGVD